MSYALVYFPPDGDRDFILDCLKNSDCVYQKADTIKGLTSFALMLDAEKLKNPSPATEKDESCDKGNKDVMARSFVQSQSFISETMGQKKAVKVEDERNSSFNEAQMLLYFHDYDENSFTNDLRNKQTSQKMKNDDKQDVIVNVETMEDDSEVARATETLHDVDNVPHEDIVEETSQEQLTTDKESGADAPQEPIVIYDGPSIDKYLASDVVDNHPVLCDKCHKSLLKEDLVKRPHECTVCGEKFRKPSGLHRHRLVVHNLDKNSQPVTKQLACTFCGKTFHLPYSLRRHMRSHTGEKPFACAKCDYKAAKKISLLKHIKRHH